MAKLIKPLTATQVASAKPKENMYKLFDGGGLFLQVNPTGGKYWKMKYRKEDGKEGLLTFGKYPAVTLELARRKRDEAKTQKAHGIDPAEAKKKEKAEKANRAKNTFQAVAVAWMEVHRTKLSPKGIYQYKNLLEKYAFPYIGTVPIRDLRAPDFMEVFRKIELLGHSSTIKRTRSAFSLIMRHAVAVGLADFDPIPALRGQLKTYKKKHYAAFTEPDDVGRLLRAIDTFSGSLAVGTALKILPYVFTRPGELRAAKWIDINFETKEWRYTAQKTGTQHIVPLCGYVISLLEQLRPLTGKSEYVFAGVFKSKAMQPISDDTIRRALRSVGITDDEATPHGFRATARTLLDEVLGERYDLIEHQLAHTVRDPNGRAYNRTHHLPERKRMMERWGQYLDNLRAGSTEIPPLIPST